MKAVIYFLLIGLFFSCGQEIRSPLTRSTQVEEYNAMTCSCSETSSPVCGFNGQHYVTILNACIAQCNGYEYKSGACPANVGSTCDENSGELCGLPPCPNNVNCEGPRLYADQCALRAAQAEVLDLSQCSGSL